LKLNEELLPDNEDRILNKFFSENENQFLSSELSPEELLSSKALVTKLTDLRSSLQQLNATSTSTAANSSAVERGIRDELYKFWFERSNRNRDCNPSATDTTTNTDTVYKSANAGMQLCFELLDATPEYVHLSEMFLLEYETCMNLVESNSSSAQKGLFNTFCLDIIVVRRMMIEYDVCCRKNVKRGANSTLCAMKNFNTKFLDLSLTKLIEQAAKPPNGAVASVRQGNFFVRFSASVTIMVSVVLVNCVLV
jgi:hypothetical protein